MKYLKVKTDITKEELKPVRLKIEEMGFIDGIDFRTIREGCVYIYRFSVGKGYYKKLDILNKHDDKRVGNHSFKPYRHNSNMKDAEEFGKEITIEEFLKLKINKNDSK